MSRLSVSGVVNTIMVYPGQLLLFNRVVENNNPGTKDLVAQMGDQVIEEPPPDPDPDPVEDPNVNTDYIGNTDRPDIAVLM